MQKLLFPSLVILLLAGCTATSRPETPVASSKRYPDVTVSRLLRVIDGDTFACDIDEHSAIAGKDISIRLRGIDTPELRSRDPALRKAAQEEKQRLADLLFNARSIELRNLGRDKYFRIDADVHIDGEPLLPKLRAYQLISQNVLTCGENPSARLQKSSITPLSPISSDFAAEISALRYNISLLVDKL